MPRQGRQTAIYAGLLAAAFVTGVAASWTPLGVKIDNAAYDWMFVLHPPRPWQPESILLAFDEASLASGGVQGLRGALAEGLERIRSAPPRAVAIDVMLADVTDSASDTRLENALRMTPGLVLPCELLPGGAWDDPIPRFRRWAAAVGHVHANPDRMDAITRDIPLEKATRRDRRWAISLEAFRVSRRASILESPDDVQVAGIRIPAGRADGRLMRVRYRPPDMGRIPSVSLQQLRDRPDLAREFSGKVVFAGVTAQSFIRDKLLTPVSEGLHMPGAEIHANAFETIAQALFLTSAPAWWVVAFSAALAVCAGIAFTLRSGWQANVLAAAILSAAPALPYSMFGRGVFFPLSTPLSTAWMTLVTAAAWRHFVVRRRLRASEAERTRYQQAMHFVTHEMRTPLTAIQGSSELMTRYAMSEEKKRQIAELINSESRRLGRMIETFLNVERLSAGQMEMKREKFPLHNLMQGCVERARPLAARKQISIRMETLPDETISGDLELMEYAFYNLLTNAVKYSPPNTQVTVLATRQGGSMVVSVKDQGIGIDPRDVRKIFRKFYRTPKAEQSGEAGTGIGLSIVEQIVARHGGRIDVESRPGEGSCFMVTLPVSAGRAAMARADT